MKKGKLLGVFVFMVVVLLISFVSAGIQTKKSTGFTTDKFLTTDKVFLKSDAGLCNEQYESVEVYIIRTGSTVLIDVSGGSQNIDLATNYAIPSNTEIWATLEVGEYDVIVDCNGDGQYHLLEPKTSFSVNFKKGTASVNIGNEIINKTWQYDSEQLILISEILQLSLLSEGEDVVLENITIQATGSGNDIEINSLEIYIDENNNQKVDEGEETIGDSQPAYFVNNGETIIQLDYTIIDGEAENILIVYEMKQIASEGEFSLSVKSIYGIGEQSDEMILFLGTPINSNVMKVLPEKTCLGILGLELVPNPVAKGLNFVAKIGDLTGCDDRIVKLRTNPCSFSVGDLDSCILKDGKCELSIIALEDKRYYVCLDKNDDNDMVDFGESSFEDLILLVEEIEEEVNETGVDEGNGSIEGNVTEEIEEIEGEGFFPGITGGVFSDLKQELLESNSILVLLEITLLLILFVLIVIAFRLKPVIKQAEELEEDEDKDEEEEKEEEEDSEEKKKKKKKKK